MNERLHKISHETDVWCDQNWYKDDSYDLRWEEKFAELIISECIGIVENLSPGYADYRNQIEDAFRIDCVEKMKTHFGVKE